MEVPVRRPSRPTRDVPAPPALDLPPNGFATESPTLDASPAQTFATPLGSPSETPLVESPATEVPPPPPPKDTLAQDATDSPPIESTNAELTPLRAHYLKKELITLQFREELRALTIIPTNNISTFSYLGPPFTPPPKDGPKLELPFLRFMLSRFVLSFPFLATAPKDFFPEKLQPFMASMLSRNLSSTSPLDNTTEDTEQAARFRLLGKIERNFAMLLTSGTKLAEEEDVVRLTQKDLDRLELMAKKRAQREQRMKNLFDVNVVCVRSVVEKKRVRNKVHEEFIIRTRRRNQADVFVSRRYGDFRTLANEVPHFLLCATFVLTVLQLRKAHPAEEVPQPPPKDRTYVNVSVSSPPSAFTSPPSPYVVNGNSSPITASMPTSPNFNYVPRAASRQQSRPMPGMYQLDRTTTGNHSVDSLHSSSSSSGQFSATYPSSPSFGSPAMQAARLTREKNRLTLRAYLHTLLSSNVFANSPVLKSFLLSQSTHLSEDEREDARRREEADQMREDGRKRFAKEIKERVEGLRGAVRSVKGELLGKDGLTHVFSVIKHTPDIRNLPENYKAVIEWARISLASTVFQHFVAADNASESFASLKRIHGMMPYFMLKAALKISNPIAMIRGVLDLFLAQPFGGKSLLQRMFTGSLMEEVRALEEDIESVKSKVEDPVLCEKVRLYVYAPREIQAVYKADALAEGVHILTAVLRSGEAPTLNRAQLQRVHRASVAHKAYTDTHPDSDDEGPEDDDAWLYEDLLLLAKLYARMRDREELISLIFEGTTADLLRDIITIFYSPLAQVYRAASVADSLGDLQNFLNDLIRTVEATEELSQQDPAKTVQIFIDLIQRHEQSFYTFVHKVHSKGEGLFDRLMRWIEQFLTLMREGLGAPISLEFLLPCGGDERMNIMKEVDAVARYHYMLKVQYEAKVRRRFGRMQGQNDADAEDRETAALVDSVVRDLSFGELISGDADELAAQDTDEDTTTSSDESDSDEDDESESDETSESASSSGSGGYESTLKGKHARQDTLTPGLARSHTVGHSPLSPRSPRSPRSPLGKQSLDLASPTRQATLPLRSSNSTPQGARTPASPSARRPPYVSENGERAPRAAAARPKSPPKKKPEGPKPPELQYLPKLLPLFVEMMRPQLQPQR
ncbi:hypothetical protein EIP86_009598 [Pleurotus ostreatoroseus]|nr:hypothetical protein EIP86_009598 [Pleurotus ostreatoroseus]